MLSSLRAPEYRKLPHLHASACCQEPIADIAVCNNQMRRNGTCIDVVASVNKTHLEKSMCVMPPEWPASTLCAPSARRS